MTLPLRTIEHLSGRLQELHARTRETPLFNPVFQLSLDLSRALEGGAMDLDALEALVEELEATGMDARAERLRALVGPVEPDLNRAELAGAFSGHGDFSAFKQAWESPRLHAVFTAHPTFLLPPAQSEAVAEAAVIGLPHADFGEGVTAVIVPATDGLAEEDVIAALRETLARYKQPKKVFIVDDLPRNAMGKVQKAALREKYSAAFTG
ncbi:MAG: hypothetical protein AAFW98_03470 [Pseudomonadota bacterium]